MLHYTLRTDFGIIVNELPNDRPSFEAVSAHYRIFSLLITIMNEMYVTHRVDREQISRHFDNNNNFDNHNLMDSPIAVHRYRMRRKGQTVNGVNSHDARECSAFEQLI